MRFQKLRLVGFKSFVEPTEFRIEPGLTGIVGPNGCGKSNLLEALRWVMGANSAKAMRAEGMDDVIFGGSGDRAPRNHAEVVLQIDNAERRAPERFNDSAVIEVARKITRGSGSTYKVNGSEARARDVQMLFADASTGANSPALVRQGQISELIAAKPSNRRRILEEAAGVSGLHSRRHEASLRLNAAEANLQRLDDVAGEIETGLNRLKREARRAETYKRLAAQIRTLQAAVLYVRWRAAANEVEAAERIASEAATAVARTSAAVQDSQAQATSALEALKPLREEEMVSVAVLQRLQGDRERAAQQAALAEAALQRLKADLARNAADAGREAQTQADAAATLERLSRERQQLTRTLETSPERTPELERRLAEAAARRACADAEVEAVAAQAAAEAARRQAAQDRLAAARNAARAAETRASEAETRLSRLQSALAAAETELASLGGPSPDDLARSRTALETARAALGAAQAALASAERERADALAAETHARTEARRLDDALRRLKTEAQGLAALVQAGAPAGGRGFAPVLDAVQAPAGLEVAVAAAFGETLDASLDPRAPAFWTAEAFAIAADPPADPDRQPLSELVQAPGALRAALTRVGLVARARGAELARTLRPGEALVSREGDLWRWDGYVASAAAPKPAAKRLAQRARLLELEAELASTAPGCAAAQSAHREAGERLRAADAALAQARRVPEAGERALAAAREAGERLEREAVRRDARAQALADTAARYRGEREEAEAAALTARGDAQTAAQAARGAEAEVAPPASTGPDKLAEARRLAVRAREAETSARGELDAETRAREGRLRRLDALGRDEADWRRRSDAARRRLDVLEGERARISEELDEARGAPDVAAAETARLAGELRMAGDRREAARRALAAGEAAALAGERAARAAEEAAATAREARAGASARLDAARDKLCDTAREVRETTELEPHALAERIAKEAVAVPADAAAVEAHLRALERERDALGAVNLRADEEAAEQVGRLQALRTERADLHDAIATLRRSIETLNAEGRERLLAAFEQISQSFKALFETLFEGGQAELRLAENDDPLEAGLEIYACPPGKRLAVMSLMSGGEQALTAMALIFAVFLANPAPVCVLDEVDAPLDDANVDRFCRMLNEMRRRTETRFIAITHNPVTMSRMDRLFGVTMAERGVSRLVSVDLREAEALAAA